MQKESLPPQEIDSILNKKSGALGNTGKYTDRRDLVKAANQREERAILAIEMEVYRLKKYIGVYAAALGRLDAPIFAAGVGEMSTTTRSKVLEGLELFGIKYDSKKNSITRTRNKEFDISAPDSNVEIFVIPADEELVFVEDAVALIEGTYDIHTNFKYTFQEKGYKNLMRERAYKKEQEELL
jgi:acetate kinase